MHHKYRTNSYKLAQQIEFTYRTALTQKKFKRQAKLIDFTQIKLQV